MTLSLVAVFFVPFLFAQEVNETLGSSLEKFGLKTEFYRELKIKQFIKLKLHDNESAKLVGESEQVSIMFEFFYGYNSSDFEVFKTMYYRPFLGYDIKRFNAQMFEIMNYKKCQPNYLPFEIHLKVARQFPVLVYRSLDTVRKSWVYGCKEKDTLGTNYWGVFYQPKLNRVVTFRLSYPKGLENPNGVKDFLLNLKPL